MRVEVPLKSGGGVSKTIGKACDADFPFIRSAEKHRNDCPLLGQPEETRDPPSLTICNTVGSSIASGCRRSANRWRLPTQFSRMRMTSLTRFIVLIERRWPLLVLARQLVWVALIGGLSGTIAARAAHAASTIAADLQPVITASNTPKLNWAKEQPDRRALSSHILHPRP
jgi:hypothetical protein